MWVDTFFIYLFERSFFFWQWMSFVHDQMYVLIILISARWYNVIFRLRSGIDCFMPIHQEIWIILINMNESIYRLQSSTRYHLLYLILLFWLINYLELMKLIDHFWSAFLRWRWCWGCFELIHSTIWSLLLNKIYSNYSSRKHNFKNNNVYIYLLLKA